MRRRFMKTLSLFLICFCLTSCQIAAQPAGKTENDKILLTVLMGESTSDPGMSDLLFEKIQSDFPNVELEWECVDWGEKFTSRLNAKIASGETPDLIIGKAQDVQAFRATGALGVFPDDLATLLIPDGTASTLFDGKLYGLTYNQLYQGVLYNKNIFYRYNLHPPKTIEELQAIVERLNQVGVTPFATHFQEIWYTGNIVMQFALGTIFLQQPDWGDRLRKGEVSFVSSDAYRWCCEQARYQLQNTWKDSLNIAQSESDLRFADEKAAMYLTGTWSVQTLQSIAPYRKIGIFPYPNPTGDAKLIIEPNITFMKSAATKHDTLLNDIYRALLTDTGLAQTLCAFTQTDTTLANVENVNSLSMIRKDIEAYRAQRQMINASVGNNQLIWAYQYDCATSLLGYMQGKAALTDILKGWDQLRSESMLE